MLDFPRLHLLLSSTIFIIIFILGSYQQKFGGQAIRRVESGCAMATEDEEGTGMKKISLST